LSDGSPRDGGEQSPASNDSAFLDLHQYLTTNV
jgi:hypothetical protein